MTPALDDDTIAAIATAAGVGGVGIIRLSGPAAIAIAADALGVAADALDRQVRVGWVRDPAGLRIDQVLAFAMRSPASFTGEDVAELQGHGGPLNLARLLEAVRARGARIAEPGEFTRRAVARGKLDLLRAEALLGVIHAGSERAWRLAQANLGGQLGTEVGAIEHRALALLAELEGWIDFPDEDLELASAQAIDLELAALAHACARLAGGFRHGRAVSDGITVALVGAVNAGKSSLLNALVGRERALVAAAPGTTRDWLEVRDDWAGVAVTVIDTAGLRATDDPIEQRGIALGEARVESADVVIVVSDGSTPWDAARYGARAILVRSKADLAPATVAVRPPRASPSQGREVERAATAALAPSAPVGQGIAGGELDPAAAATRIVAGEPAGSARVGQVGGIAGGEQDRAVAATGSGPDVIATSATTGQGLDLLRRHVLAVAGVADQEGSEQAFVTTARQREVAVAACRALSAAQLARQAGQPPEIVAVELREAVRALAQLRGVEVGERVLDEVFARFCIGK